MLRQIGVASIENLFDSIPEDLRLRQDLKVPAALSELELLAKFEQTAARNPAASRISFLGGGAYAHYSPTIVDHLTSRSEFFTAYTPYQPEISQGTLQAIFEFQTLVCQLTGMEIANASMYDGSTALPESLAAIDDQTAAIVVQSPNFFGCIEDLKALGDKAHAQGALLIVAVTEAMSFGLLRSPGACGADIVVAEGQSFGVPLSYGGPYVGLFATRDKYARQIPRRLVGRTYE